jgi:hypothetical protein
VLALVSQSLTMPTVVGLEMWGVAPQELGLSRAACATAAARPCEALFGSHLVAMCLHYVRCCATAGLLLPDWLGCCCALCISRCVAGSGTHASLLCCVCGCVRVCASQLLHARTLLGVSFFAVPAAGWQNGRHHAASMDVVPLECGMCFRLLHSSQARISLFRSCKMVPF